jgi:transketolase
MTVPIDTSPAIKFQKHPLDGVCINTIRTLAIDAIQAANSGHPGTPMAMVPFGYYLWQYILPGQPASRQLRRSTRLAQEGPGVARSVR